MNQRSRQLVKAKETVVSKGLEVGKGEQLHQRVVKIAVIGDSTAMQFGSVETCWPREMCLEVERVLDCKVNLKLMGAYFQTAERALRRNVQRAVKFDPDLIVLAVGCSEAVWQFPAAA